MTFLRNALNKFKRALAADSDQTKKARAENIKTEQLAKAKGMLLRAGALGKILTPLLSRDAETTWVSYTASLNGLSREDTHKFSSTDVKKLLPVIQPVKARYYECIISMLGAEHKAQLDSALYPPEIDAQDMRDKLMCLEVAETEDFYKNRLQEYEVLFGAAPALISKDVLMSEFENNKGTPDELFDTIKEQYPQYFARKMLLPTFQDLLRAKLLLGDRFSSGKAKVLDYGCGSADTSLFLASYGHEVTLCDVGGMLDSAVKRFNLRGLNVNAVYAESDMPIPALSGTWDLIIAVEVIEHIFNPFELLELIDRVCAPDGVILLGTFPFVATNSYGDHLAAAVERRDELKNWIESRWERITTVDGYGNAFRKRG